MEANLNLYHIFYTVANCKNISAAGKQLFISQPAISKAISKLEDTLETKLFIRNSRGVTLTREGEYLYEQLHFAFTHIKNGENKIKKMHQLGVGHISIGVSTTLCKYLLLPILNKYIKENPHIRLKITCLTSSETLSALEKGNIDLGLIGLPEKIHGFTSTPIGQIHDTFVTTERYLKNLEIREGVIQEKALSNSMFMMLHSENISRKYVDQFLRSEDTVLNEIMEVGNMDLLIEFAKIDLGIACVIREFVQKELENGELVEISLGKEIPKREVGFLYPASLLKENPAANSFIKYIVNNRNHQDYPAI